MANFNKVYLMGRLTREVDLRYTPKGTAVADMGMAVNRSRKGDGGERVEETTFVDVTVWGRIAESCSTYLSKGRGVFVEGRLALDEWEDKESGKKRFKLKVVGEKVEFLGGGNRGAAGGSAAGRSKGDAEWDKMNQEDEEDDTPF